MKPSNSNLANSNKVYKRAKSYQKVVKAADKDKQKEAFKVLLQGASDRMYRLSQELTKSQKHYVRYDGGQMASTQQIRFKEKRDKHSRRRLIDDRGYERE